MKKTKLPYFITAKRARVLVELYMWEAKENRPPAMQDLADLLGLSRAGIYQHLQRLLRDGFVTKHGCKYVVSVKGADYLEPD